MIDSTPSAPTSLLIVEDSRIQAKILADKLTEAGYDVRVAQNGQIGLEKIREKRPTLVISDIEMPLMTGYELCSAVKSDEDFRTIPFILLSTLSDPQDIIKGLHCGADNYVTKPYDPEYLIGRVESLLSTPLQYQNEEEQLNVTLGGTSYSVKAGRQQVLNLLVSTFENAVEKNNELIHANEELTIAKEQLTQWNQKLESLNDRLESANDRMTRDLDAASKLQQSLLPSADFNSDRVSFAWKYLPCDELAGDFLNYFPLDEENIAVYVADVSGHGVASSLLSVAIGRMLTPQASASSLLTKPAEDGQGVEVVSPAVVLDELNQRFPMQAQNGMYFTIVYGVLNLRSLEFKFASASHEPLVHVLSSGGFDVHEGEGTAIGWFDDEVYEEQLIQLGPGDRLYLYSDGVPEAMNESLDQFTLEQMLEIVELGNSRSLDDCVTLLTESVSRWCIKNGPKDDVSILGLEIAAE